MLRSTPAALRRRKAGQRGGAPTDPKSTGKDKERDKTEVSQHTGRSQLGTRGKLFNGS